MWGSGSGEASMAEAPGPQRGERVLNKCLWRRRGRRLPSARVLALMHCAPRAEEAAPAFSATAAAAAPVRAARGRISHAHAARHRRHRGLGAAGRPLKGRSADPVPGPSQASCGCRASSPPPPQAPPLAPPRAVRRMRASSSPRPAPGESRGVGAERGGWLN